MFGFHLTPEQVEIQNQAREFALREILPVAWHYDALDDTPLPVLRKAWEAGIMNTDIHLDKDTVHLEPGTTPWRCRICGQAHYGDEPPEECPYWLFPKSAFKKV